MVTRCSNGFFHCTEFARNAFDQEELRREIREVVHHREAKHVGVLKYCLNRLTFDGPPGWWREEWNPVLAQFIMESKVKGALPDVVGFLMVVMEMEAIMKMHVEAGTMKHDPKLSELCAEMYQTRFSEETWTLAWVESMLLRYSKVGPSTVYI
mmetsp:Transcript_29833/g.36214  ORF Transcript_29833/g.36214 Transcript_29833/m.36214 type:complete len:153 (-) Transcript_29833:2-460(-)